MELMPTELRECFPKLGDTESQWLDAIVQAKFFTPDSNWTWFATEFDGEDLFFGFVIGFEPELGYFRLSEIQEVRGGLGLPVERDLWFTPKTLRAVARESAPEWLAMMER